MLLCVFLAKVTKFSRYNESSDSDECETSDSDSSSTDADDDDDDGGGQPASKDDGHQTDAVDVDISLTLADNQDDFSSDSASISERSPTSRLSETAGPIVPSEQADIPSKDGDTANIVVHSPTSRLSESKSPMLPSKQVDFQSKDGEMANISEHSQTRHLSETKVWMVQTEQSSTPTKDDTDCAGSGSGDSDSSSSSTNRTPPSPIRTPLKFDSAGHSSSRGKFPKYVRDFRHRVQTDRRQPVPRNERLPLRRTNSFLSKNFSSTSDLHSLSHPVNKTSSPYRHSAVYDNRQSPFRPRSQERRLYSGDRPKSRSRSSERGRQSPPRSRYDANVDRTKYSQGGEYSPRPRSRSRSLSVGKSPHGRPLPGVSPHQRTSLSRDNDLPRSSRSQSSSRSYRQSGSRSRSGSGERFVGSSRVQSRSRSPTRSPLHRQRSGSVDRKSDLPASFGDVHQSPRRNPPAAGAYKDAARRRSSRRSLSADRELLSRYPRDVSPPQAVESHKLSAKLPPYRSYSRSPERMERKPQRTDAKSLLYPEFLENPNSDSRTSLQHGNGSPIRSSQRHSSPSQHGMKKLGIGRYQRLTDKPIDGISRRLPEVRDRISPQPSVARKRSTSSDSNRAVSQRRSSPPDSVSTETKIDPRYRLRPIRQPQKPPAKSEDEPRALAQKKYGQTSMGSRSKHSRMLVDQSEDSSVVERLKNLAEPDKPVKGKSESITESARSPHRDQSHIQEAGAESTKDLPAHSNTGKDTRKAVTLKCPAAPVAAILEARKRRFQQMQNSDSQPFSVRSDAAGHTNRHRQLSPERLKKSKQIGKDLNKVVGRSEISSKSKLRDKKKKKASEKVQAETSDLSDIKSADSSMSLEDISEDETPQVQDKRFDGRSDLRLTQQRSGQESKLGKQGVQRHGRGPANNDDDDDAMDRRSSTVSSVVKSIKRVADLPKVVARQSQSAATELRSSSDESDTSEDDAVVNAPKRNVISKGWYISLRLQCKENFSLSNKVSLLICGPCTVSC